MDDQQYDNTNRGAIFAALQSEWLSGTGKVNIDGTEYQVAVVRRTNQDGTETRDLYVKVGRLFPNKSDNEKAPALSGPFDWMGGKKRIAGWNVKTPKGVELLSVRVSDAEGQQGGGHQQAGPAVPPASDPFATNALGEYLGDDIPFT